MRQALHTGTKLQLNTADLSINGLLSIVVNDVIGMGATCIVYDVSYSENIGTNIFEHRGILKEFYPVDRRNTIFGISRDVNGVLHCPEDLVENFLSEKQHFLKSYKVLTEIRSQIDAMRNDTSDGQLVLEGNNTLYLLFSADNGINYSEYKEMTLYEIIQMAISITKAISKYHENGMLHMDIKPENIFVTDTEKQIIKLFDFDSVVKIEDLKEQPLEEVSFSREWAAPEVLSMSIDEICEASDIYSIGAIVFERIMHQMPQLQHKKNFASFCFDKNDLLFDGIPPKVYPMLETFFRKTLCVSVERRFQTADELCDYLLLIKQVVDPDNPYLKDNRSKSWLLNDYYVERNTEKLELDSILSKSNYAFVEGIGGIGKTTFIKEYAYNSKYECVYFSRFRTTLRDYILSMTFAKLNDSEWVTSIDGKKDDSALLERKIKLLSELDENTLIIVDNYNVECDELFDNLISCGAKVVFTTRMQHKDQDGIKINITELSNEDSCLLFAKYYGGNVENIDELFELIHKNTLLIKLIACTIERSRGLINLNDIIGKLKHNQLNDIKVNVKHQDGVDNLVNQTIYAHLESLFDFSNMSIIEQNVMQILALVAGEEFSISEFLQICNIDNKFDTVNAINELYDNGWIMISEDVISIHPMIAETILENDNRRPTFKDNKSNISLLLECAGKFKSNEYELKYKYFRAAVSALIKLKDIDISFIVDGYLDIFSCVFKEGMFHECNRIINKLLPLCDDEEDDMKCALKAWLYSYLVSIQMLYGKVDEAEENQKKLEEIVEKSNMEDYPFILAQIFDSASVYYREHGENERAISYIQAYRKLMDLNGNDCSEDEITTLMSEGRVYYQLGRYAQAIECYKKANKIVEKLSLQDSSHQLCTWVGLGTNYMHSGSMEIAEGYFKKLIDKTDSILPRYNPLRCNIYNDLGLFYSTIYSIDNAKKYYKEAMITAEKIYEKTSSVFLTIRINYAECLERNKEHDEAISILNDVINLEPSFQNDTVLAGAYNLLGIFYINKEIYLLALDNFEQCYEIRKNRLSENVVNIAVSIGNIAYAYANLERFDEAERHFNKAIKLFNENNLGISLYTASVTHAYALMYSIKKDYDNAIDWFKTSLDIRVKVFGKVSTYVAECLKSIANTLWMQRRYDGAFEIFYEAESILKKLGERYKYMLIDHYIEVSTLLLSIGKYDECITMCEDALDIDCTYKKELLYNNIGTVYAEKEEYGDAIKYYNMAFECERDDNQENFGVIYVNYGVVGLANGYYDKAIEYFKNGIELYELYGTNIEKIFIAYVRTAECFYNLEEYSDSINMCEKAVDISGHKDNNLNELKKLMYEILVESYKKIGNIEKSDYYQNNLDLMNLID